MKRLRTMVFICFVLLLVCGCQNESGEKTTSFNNVTSNEKEAQNSLEGRYFVLEGIYKLKNSADEDIEHIYEIYNNQCDVCDSSLELKVYKDDYTMSHVSGLVLLPDNTFIMYPTDLINQVEILKGKYRVIDNQIKLEYESFTRYSGVYPLYDKVPQKVSEYKEGDDLFDDWFADLNKEGDGSFYRHVYPRSYEGYGESEFLRPENYKKIPAPVGACYAGRLGNADENIDGWKKQYFTPVDDFLCTETVGMYLNGSYETGNDFSISYDFTAVTDANYKRSDILARDLRRSAPKALLDGVSTIHFTNNYWEWVDYQGDILGKGTYTESQLYKGLIKYCDEDKNRTFYIYIDDCGQIWFPYMIKYND